MVAVKVQQSKFKTETGCVSMISGPQTMSRTFNGFFVDISQQLTSNIYHTGEDYYYERHVNVCKKKPVVAEETIEIISKFKQK